MIFPFLCFIYLFFSFFGRISFIRFSSYHVSHVFMDVVVVPSVAILGIGLKYSVILWQSHCCFLAFSTCWTVEYHAFLSSEFQLHISWQDSFKRYLHSFCRDIFASLYMGLIFSYIILLLVVLSSCIYLFLIHQVSYAYCNISCTHLRPHEFALLVGFRWRQFFCNIVFTSSHLGVTRPYINCWTPIFFCIFKARLISFLFSTDVNSLGPCTGCLMHSFKIPIIFGAVLILLNVLVSSIRALLSCSRVHVNIWLIVSFWVLHIGHSIDVLLSIWWLLTPTGSQLCISFTTLYLVLCLNCFRAAWCQSHWMLSNVLVVHLYFSIMYCLMGVWFLACQIFSW